MSEPPEDYSLGRAYDRPHKVYYSRRQLSDECVEQTDKTAYSRKGFLRFCLRCWQSHNIRSSVRLLYCHRNDNSDASIKVAQHAAKSI